VGDLAEFRAAGNEPTGFERFFFMDVIAHVPRGIEFQRMLVDVIQKQLENHKLVDFFTLLYSHEELVGSEYNPIDPPIMLARGLLSDFPLIIIVLRHVRDAFYVKNRPFLERYVERIVSGDANLSAVKVAIHEDARAGGRVTRGLKREREQDSYLHEAQSL
jgi:hypothetical protein